MHCKKTLYMMKVHEINVVVLYRLLECGESVHVFSEICLVETTRKCPCIKAVPAGPMECLLKTGHCF